MKLDLFSAGFPLIELKGVRGQQQGRSINSFLNSLTVMLPPMQDRIFNQ